MEPTTITTICMILFAMGMITWAIYLWFSDWQPEARRYRSPEEQTEAEIQEALRQMRQAIEDYERGERHL
jgi:type II secretory pathway component PulM